jgi:Protein of unknown function (DUF3000)
VGLPIQNPAFEETVADIRKIAVRNEILLEEVPAPSKLAPSAFAMNADVLEDVATGRFVLLHDPDGQEGWSGQYRCVTFVRAALDPEMASDPILNEIGWAWLLESLAKYSCDFSAPSGTVTRVTSTSFGTLENREEVSEIEIRASWTPNDPHRIPDHLLAWIQLLEIASGLIPVPEGVTQLMRPRN